MSHLAKCEGELVIKRAGGNEIIFYEEEFVLSNEVASLEEARSVIQAALLDNRMRRKVEGYKSWRTCQVVSFEPTKQKNENSPLEALLLEATKKGCLPENIGSYADDASKMKAIERSLKNLDERVKKEAEKEAARKIVEAGSR